MVYKKKCNSNVNEMRTEYIERSSSNKSSLFSHNVFIA